ncbi:uncharacterized protein LOC130901190 isoform X1 [Diorhabda carinulata]|uniref:uncharacterized protein LOC130447469 n=1 Tax=Diorhabda sublineata TaxID=1163346 RepID=UPI0024E09219|nr:uncharacterized protein LOC130447469 [Diorhabda sublineata]XP_056640403.1 uncharacterized protein LOC130447469 [Diorhabda sublineata]XP_057668346.1 uncharacterized protein LOC130901190 isoform X1 [Diorhabda carinulata]
MRAPFYLVCATLVVSIHSEDTTGNAGYFNREQIEPINMAADQETISYLLPKLTAKYRPSNEWTGVTDPRFYLLTEMESNELENQERLNKKIRNKRFNIEVNPQRQTRYYDLDDAPSLSINAPIQTLRKAYAIERLRERVRANREFLKNLNDLQ